ncbi:hypothetical protein FA10DRAFT_304822 [Acaromyces ingoldii]|uniref:Carrier domain-containing protein n=1 Tax=Acaromyces ingoldii TaxID=215250 RepID=A0A316YAQ5_9BASI|nr:hypothetical protein FA10DRAFT_304822 [Acaromyces ingoldii]PWN86716.1 hypothetical protein FA10DRAFT_304822 [Acaromyces ingoldii]
MDAVDGVATRQLCADNDLQGAFFLPLALFDKRLNDLTTADFEHVSRPKLHGLEDLLRHLTEDAWLIATASLLSLHGSQVPANYSATNIPGEERVALEGLGGRGLLHGRDATVAMGDTVMLHWDVVPGLFLSLRAQHSLCRQLDISLLARFKGAMRHLCIHLMNQRISTHTCMAASVSMRSLFAMHLDMDPNEVRDDNALKNYGFDSLSASRLSAAIRQHFGVDVSQLQLLSDANLGRLEALAATAGHHLPLQNRESRELDADDCVVTLNNVADGQNLFILHGGGIVIRHFATGLLGCHFPSLAADEILQNYADQIRRVQPQGRTA